ncbi:MAG: porin family protein [Chitinophagales bacterium]
MKYFLLLIFSCISIAPSFAQEDTAEDDFSKSKEKAQTTINETASRDRVVVELTFDNWFHNVDSLQTKWHSLGFNFHFMYDMIIKKSRFSFAPGIGIGTSHIYNNSEIVKTDSTSFFRPIGDGDQKGGYTMDELKGNKLTLVYLDVPLELRYRAKPNNNNKAFKMAIGVKGSVLVQSHTKTRFTDSFGDTKKIKDINQKDLLKFRAAATFRIGYGPFNVLAVYNLTNLFKKDRGPIVTPFSLGISFNGL